VNVFGRWFGAKGNITDGSALDPHLDLETTMHKITLIATLVTLAVVPAFAQSAGGQEAPTTRYHARAETPIDHGPFTPEASRAYEGGGVIL
jgi:hypothetical protein